MQLCIAKVEARDELFCGVFGQEGVYSVDIPYVKVARFEQQFRCGMEKRDQSPYLHIVPWSQVRD